MLWPVGCRDVQDQADTQDSFFLCIQVPSWCCRHTGTAGLLRAVTTPAHKEAKQCLCPPKSQGECLAQCSFEPESVPSVSSASCLFYKDIPYSSLLTNRNYCSAPVRDHIKDPKHRAASAQPAPSHLVVRVVVTHTLSHSHTDFTNALPVTMLVQLLCSLKKARSWHDRSRVHVT